MRFSCFHVILSNKLSLYIAVIDPDLIPLNKSTTPSCIYRPIPTSYILHTYYIITRCDTLTTRIYKLKEYIQNKLLKDIPNVSV